MRRDGVLPIKVRKIGQTDKQTDGHQTDASANVIILASTDRCVEASFDCVRLYILRTFLASLSTFFVFSDGSSSTCI